MNEVKNNIESYSNACPYCFRFSRDGNWAKAKLKCAALVQNVFEATLTKLGIDELGTRAYFCLFKRNR